MERRPGDQRRNEHGADPLAAVFSANRHTELTNVMLLSTFATVEIKRANYLAAERCDEQD